jgi:hypothetical protein
MSSGLLHTDCTHARQFSWISPEWRGTTFARRRRPSLLALTTGSFTHRDCPGQDRSTSLLSVLRWAESDWYGPAIADVSAHSVVNAVPWAGGQADGRGQPVVPRCSAPSSTGRRLPAVVDVGTDQAVIDVANRVQRSGLQGGHLGTGSVRFRLRRVPRSGDDD